jgi:predicted alpha/beta-fold hydrolase
LTCSTSWEDIREIVDHVNKKYVIDPITKEKRVRYYGYGTSLGANLLGLYLCHSKKECPFDAATLLAPPYDIIQNYEQFYNGSFPYYSYIIG